MDTVKYARKPFEVDAVQVTNENMSDVSQWCGGNITTEDSKSFIKVEVDRAINEKQTKAFVGDWVLKSGSGFKIYNDKAFKRSFKRVALDPPQELLTTAAPATA